MHAPLDDGPFPKSQISDDQNFEQLLLHAAARCQRSMKPAIQLAQNKPNFIFSSILVRVLTLLIAKVGLLLRLRRECRD